MTMTTKSGGLTHVVGQPEVRHESNRIAREVKAILFAALAVAGGTAGAQEAGVSGIEEVVVTATRREQSFRDVPMAVSALDSQRLQDTGVTEFNDIQSQVPSFEIEANTNPFTTSLRIRGMGNLANIPNFEPAVGLFVDGAYRSRSGVAMGDLLDVERIEILRGPQSVLYPKNVTAGLVNVITQRPTDDFSAWGGASFGNLNYWQLQGGINGALADGVRGRLAAVTSDRDGSFNDTVNGTKSGGFARTAFRGQLEFDIGDRANLRLIAGYSDKDGDCCSPDVLPGAVSTRFLGLLGRPVDSDPFNRRTTYSDPYRFEGDQYDLLADFSYDFDWAVLTSTTSYDHFSVESQIDSEQSAFTAAVFLDRQDSDALGQEFRLTSQGDGPISWMTGAYYYDNDFTRGSLSPNEPILVLGPDIVPLPAPFNGAAGDQSSFRSLNDTRHWSLFGQLDWQATERTKLSAGLRYIDEKKSIDVRSNYLVAALPSLALNTTVPTPVVAERSMDGLAWNLSALFDVAADTTVYATVSEGYKAGGYNGDWDASGALTAAKREFDDESVLTLEAGLKSRFWDGQATLNLSVFRSEFDDFQNASFLGLNFLVRNAESVVTQGIELDGSVRPVTGLTIDYAIAYLDAEYDKFTRGACYFGRTPTNAAERTCDLSGETLPNAPTWRSNLGAQFEQPLATGTGFLRADWSYSSELNVDTALDPRAEQGSYSLLSARLGWRNDRYSVSVWGDNLTDETVMTAAGPQTIFGGIDGGLQIYLNESRTYGVTMDVRF
ncbi:MAG: TonB-dependent receptor [Gammaproteobacteria bacterium]|nr:TonB-dependent receptor [Gammaproteobacteria bacterium]